MKKTLSTLENLEFVEKGCMVMQNILRKKSMLVFAIGLLLIGCNSRNSHGPQQKPATEVGTITLQAQQVVLTTELPGRTVASVVSEIRPQVNGLIIKRAFEEGSFVKAGDVLYQIDPKHYQAAYHYAKANVALAEASLPAVRLREQRYKELVASHAVGQQDYDDALAALHQAEAQLKSSMAALETAEINLAYTSIKSPVSGLIGRSNVTQGALVIEYQPTSLAAVQQLDPIYVDVPQSTVELLRLQNRMKEGNFKSDNAKKNKVEILREDGTSYPLSGTLEFRDVTVNPTTGSVILRIVVPNPDGTLLPGMFVRAVLKEGIVEDGILVPQIGVSRDQKGNPYSWIVDGSGKAEMRMIMIDRAIGDQWLVSNGLNAGDKVIVDGFQRIQPGSPVTAVAADAQANGQGQDAKPGSGAAKK